jgi:hypothetical protein
MTSTIVLWDEEHPEKTLTTAQLGKMQFARLKDYCQIESRLMQLSPGGFTGTRSLTLHQPATSKGLFLGFQGIRESTKVIIQGYFLVTFVRFGSDPVAPLGRDICVELSAPEFRTPRRLRAEIHPRCLGRHVAHNLLYFKRIRDLSYATSLRLAEIRLEYAMLHAGHASSDESQPFFRWRDWISHSSIHGWGNREAQSSRREWKIACKKICLRTPRE